MKSPFPFLMLLTMTVAGAFSATSLSRAEEAATRFVIAGPDHVLDGWVNRKETSFTNPVLHNHGTAWVNYHRCLMRFDLGAIDSKRFGRVGKATLRLTVTEAENPAQKVTNVAPSTQPWTDQATFWTTDGETPWPASKGHRNIDYAMRNEDLQSLVIETPGIVEFDVTAVVDRWLYQGLANHGFLLRTGGPIFGVPDAGSWKQTFAASEVKEGGPVLIVEMVGEPPTPDTIPQRTLRWFPSAVLPPVRDPYIIYWDFGRPPRLPGAASNASGTAGVSVAEGVQQGMLVLNWFYGPQNPWLKNEKGFVDSYVNTARGKTLGIMVDEWQSPKKDAESGSRLHADAPFGITGSIKGMIEAKKVDPSLFIGVAWRGESSIEPATREGAVDLLMIEAYTHVGKRIPVNWGIGMEGIKRRIDFARELGMIERTICWLGHIHKPEEYHEGHVLTPELVAAQVAELRAHAPEMPGIAFYANTDEELARACDRAARKYFIDPAPEVIIVEPSFQDHLTTPHVTIRVEAKSKDEHTISHFRWFIDNRLIAETETPCYVWDLRGENPGHHILTVHAIDNAFNRAATQIRVRTTRE